MIRTETSAMLKSLNGSGSSNVNRVRINPRALLAVHLQPRFDAIHARHLHIEVHTVRVRSLNNLTVADKLHCALQRRCGAQGRTAVELNLVAIYPDRPVGGPSNECKNI